MGAIRLLLLALVAAAAAAASPPPPQATPGNIGLMPRLPPTYSLIDWRARAEAWVSYVLSNTSAAVGVTEFYVSTSAGPSLGLPVYDIATYVGAPPKREAFGPLETLITAALLGVRLDRGCSPALDDCVATALQYVQPDGLVGHYVAPSAGGAASDVTQGQLWDALYSGILFAQVAAVYPDYYSPQAAVAPPAGSGQSPVTAPAPALGPRVVANALRWHDALVALGGGTAALDFNITGYNFSSMSPYTLPVEYLDPSASAGVAWLAMAAREWNAYRNASEPPSPALDEALDWSLAYLDARNECFFENLVGFGALAAARSNAERGTAYRVEHVLGVLFQNGSANSKHGYGVATGTYGGLDVSGLVGFTEEWAPDQPYGVGGSEVYSGDSLWVAGSVLPIARYNASFASALGTYLVNVCSAVRLFYPDQLPRGSQTDFGDARNVGSVFPYEALRACDFVREAANCTPDSPSPFATGDYGCEYPTGDPRCSLPRACPNCTNLSGYDGASVGIAAALCVPTNVTSVLQADLLATDFFHAPAYPTYLVHNPHSSDVQVEVAVPGCALVHWAAGSGAGAGGEAQACAVVDTATGEVLARGVSAPGTTTIGVPAGAARVISCVPDN